MYATPFAKTTLKLTLKNQQTAMPIIDKLDPYNFFILYKLFREATRSVNGKIVKVSLIICCTSVLPPSPAMHSWLKPFPLAGPLLPQS